MTDARRPEAWEAGIPEALRQDPLWRMEAFRLATRAADEARLDALHLARLPAIRGLASQLLRAAGSVGANITEGYGRRSPADRSRFFAIALGSARETTYWYVLARFDLDGVRVEHQLARLRSVTRLLTRAIQTSRDEARSMR